MGNENKTNYLGYLVFITEKLDKFFNKQKPYIFCQKGCAKCCQNAEFPFSNVEAEYLLEGYEELDDNTKRIILEQTKVVKAKQKENKETPFLYDCPFLVNNVCSVYGNRGIICRSFGLIYVGADGKNKIPFCCNMGLNFSNVYDEETKTVSEEKFKALNVEEEPVAFNVDYKTLTDDALGDGFQFKFGEKRRLIDWLKVENDKLVLDEVKKMENN